VYPVPDGDTGTNMALTLESVVRSVNGVDDMASVCRAIAHGSLMGARGNSGVILSQLLRGLSERMPPSAPAGPKDLAVAFDHASREAFRAVARFVRAEFRELAGIFLLVLALVVAAMFASALAWSGVGLIAFVPLVGLAVFPLQLAALLVRGLVFEYLGLTALGAYVVLYTGDALRRTAAVKRSAVRSPVQHPV